jgi:hypothetical protein
VHRKHLAILLLAYLAQFICFTASGQKIIPYTGPMPVPVAGKHQLFYLQRTIDVNTLIYEMNYKADGQIDKAHPVKIYWIRYTAEGEKTAPLSYAQNKFAYGIAFTELKGPEPIFRIHLVSYKKIEIYLKPTGEKGSYQAHITLQGKACILKNLMVHISGGTYLKPHVSHIELKGKDLASGEWIGEKIRP